MTRQVPLAPEVVRDLTARAIKRMGGAIDAGSPGEGVTLLPAGPTRPYDWSEEED